MVLQPAAATSPALTHHLLPSVLERTGGDAVTLYFTAAERLSASGDNKLNRVVDMLWDATPEQLLREGPDALAPFSGMLDDVAVAARREHCSWDPGLREQGPANFSLAYLNSIRAFTNVLGCQERLDLARKDFPAAEHDMQTGFAMARQLNYQPALVQGLVSVGCAEVMVQDGAQSWIATGGPNLYWALTELPQPFVDLPAIVDWEQAEPFLSHPQFTQALEDQLPADQWTVTLTKILQMQIDFGWPKTETAPTAAKRLERYRASALPHAKEYLHSIGMTDHAIEALPADAIVGKFFVHQYRVISDDLWKVFALPYPQAITQIEKPTAALAFEQAGPDSNPFLSLLPDNRRLCWTFTHLQRSVDVLRTIEAIRDYAANHDGQPPATLDQIVNLPVPMDPITGKLFDYHIEGNTAIINTPAPSFVAPSRGSRYEITFTR
jgi:hypothetical protein